MSTPCPSPSSDKPQVAAPAILELDKLSACVHCGLCLPTCATYRATGSEVESPRGRLYLMRKWMEGELTDESQIKPHLDQCLACHACETVCPSGVKYGDLLFEAREHLSKDDHQLKRYIKRFAFRHILPSKGRLSLMRNVLRGYQKSGLQQLVRSSHILSIIPILAAQEALMPTVPEHHALKPGMRFGAKTDPLLALMTGCVMDAFFNPIHWQTVYVLVKNGYQVLIPEQTCCGALAHHAGEVDIAKELAKQNIEQVMPAQPEWILLNSAGCGSTMQAYDHLIPENTQSAEFSKKVIDIMALLFQKPLSPFPGNSNPQVLAYHAACHLYHVQKVKTEPMVVLAQIPNTAVTPLREIELCCGSAGIYNLEYPELADEMLAKKMDSVEATVKESGASILVSGNPGCLMQIAKGLKERHIDLSLKHPVEVLAEAYGYQSVSDVLAMRQ